MVLPENIDSGRSNFQLDTRHSGCRRTLVYLLSIHSMKHAAVSSTDQGGGKRRAGMKAWLWTVGTPYVRQVFYLCTYADYSKHD
jgi:hypothetical protein